MIAITETFSGVVPVENTRENKPSLPVRCIGQIPGCFMIVRSMVTTIPRRSLVFRQKGLEGVLLGKTSLD